MVSFPRCIGSGVAAFTPHMADDGIAQTVTSTPGVGYEMLGL